MLIPFFDAMTWRTKKEKDYQDWKAAIILKELDLLKTEEGNKLILLIISQMNNKRLSSSKYPRVDRDLLLKKIDELIKGKN